MNVYKYSVVLTLIFSLFLIHCTQSQQSYVRDNYDKKEYMIEMRDGVKLFTAV